MKLNTVVLDVLLLALLASCGGGQGDLQGADRVTMDAAYGSSLASVELTQSGIHLTLTFEELPAAGAMLRLNLPAGLTVADDTWSQAAHAIHLVAPVPQGVEIGVVPVSGYYGETVTANLVLGEGSRAASVAPLGQANVITDLTITSPDFGVVELSWTQMNSGDYDFNGQVNISDLTPLAPRIGDSIDRDAVDASLQTAYWIDGDANGEINISDITPIGAHYGAHVFGYNIKRNGTTLEGDGPGEPTLVAEAKADKRVGLPNRYTSVQTGLTSDTWVVTPVDVDLNEGADSTGNPGSAPVDLETSLNVVGLDLRDLETGVVGEFGEGKFSTRVIDPGDVVNRAPVGTTVLKPGGSSISNLPRGQVFMVDFRFAPTVDLRTGAPRGASGLKGTSAVPDDEIVNAAVIFELPEGTEPGAIDSMIEAAPNPEGGYLLTMTSTISMPGDDPSTPAVEADFTKTEKTQIDFANGTVARDTNGNGFEDNPKVGDDDRDGVGENERRRFREFEDGDRGDAEEMGIVALVRNIDFLAGSITLSVLGNNGEHVKQYPGPFSVEVVFDALTEVTEFMVRTDEDEILDWTLFNVGDEVEVDLYDSLTGEGYWIEKVKRDDRTDDDDDD
jgi:hypothetical protein